MATWWRDFLFGLRLMGKNKGFALVAVLAVAGLALGLVGRAMQSMLYGVSAMDYGAFSAVGAVLLGTALAACLVPARRAASVDPMAALRQE